MTIEENATDRVRDVVARHCSQWSVSEYDLPSEFRNNPTLNAHRCPRCQGNGIWRRGQEFDHMKRCGKCGIVWTPDSVVTLQQILASELTGVDGDGI